MSIESYGGRSAILPHIAGNGLTRAISYAILFGCLFVLGMDLHDIVARYQSTAPAVVTTPVVAPSVVRPGHATLPNSVDPRPLPNVRSGGIEAPIAFSLAEGGVLSATGTIDEGAAARFADALQAHHGMVRTVALNSPGGALDDAILMARAIRDRGLDTVVPGGAVCASSCPLVLAGGVRRQVAETAAIGVHQFYASRDLAEDPAQVMADAQLATARIVRHLEAMGVEPALWFNALATPPQALYYLSAREMADYRLTTAPLTAVRESSADRS